MSMSHVNPNSPQTRAWVEYAHATEGRIQRSSDESNKDGKNTNQKKRGTMSERLDRKLKIICSLLDCYSFEESRGTQKIKVISYPVCTNYTRLLAELGLIKLSKVSKNRKFYIRVEKRYPTLEEVRCK